VDLVQHFDDPGAVAFGQVADVTSRRRQLDERVVEIDREQQPRSSRVEGNVEKTARALDEYGARRRRMRICGPKTETRLSSAWDRVFHPRISGGARDTFPLPPAAALHRAELWAVAVAVEVDDLALVPPARAGSGLSTAVSSLPRRLARGERLLKLAICA